MAQVKDGQIKYGQGSLYSFQNNKVSTHTTKIGMSNGLAFDAEAKKFYHVDSHLGTVDQYDFDIEKGSISNRKTIFTLKEGSVETLQVLDGMAIDTDGNLWVAVFNLGKVIRIDPRKPETIADSIQFPGKQITSIAFGGPNLDELYVTSGNITLANLTPTADDDGAVYRVTGLNAKGFPGVRVVL